MLLKDKEQFVQAEASNVHSSNHNAPGMPSRESVVLGTLAAPGSIRPPGVGGVGGCRERAPLVPGAWLGPGT